MFFDFFGRFPLGRAISCTRCLLLSLTRALAYIEIIVRCSSFVLHHSLFKIRCSKFIFLLPFSTTALPIQLRRSFFMSLKLQSSLFFICCSTFFIFLDVSLFPFYFSLIAFLKAEPMNNELWSGCRVRDSGFVWARRSAVKTASAESPTRRGTS